MSYTLFVILAPLSAAMLIGVLINTWRYRAAPGARPLLFLMLLAAGWLVTNTMEVVAQTEAATLFWSRLTYVCIAFISLPWLAVALEYTGQQAWLKPRRFGILFIVPLLTVVFVFSNETHQLMWEGFNYISHPFFLGIKPASYGPWFFIHLTYTYALMAIGCLLLLRDFIQPARSYRQQVTWLLVGALTPLAFNALYVFRIFDFDKDFSPISFAIASLAFAVGIHRYQLFDMKPVAHTLLIQNLADGVLVIDDRERIVDINPAAQAFLQTSAERCVGQPVKRLLPAEALAVLQAAPPSNGVTTELTLEYDSDPRFYELRVTRLPNQQGFPDGRILTLLDITEHKQAEQKLQHLNDELHARNVELDAFAHTVAHDLKNPIHSLIGYAQVLVDDYETIDPTLRHEFLVTIAQTSEKMHAIVQELLLLSGLHRRSVECYPLDMEAIFSEALLRFKTNLKQQGGTLQAPETWPVAIGYGPWVEEVWSNYLSNALKYGGTPPEITVGATPQADGQIRFWVRDNGPGLTAEERASLFKPFTRLKPIKAEGHGLGLSIVRRIIERLGGTCGLESSPEACPGSTFYFTLPTAGQPPAALGPAGIHKGARNV